jgi:hypothetical protein
MGFVLMGLQMLLFPVLVSAAMAIANPLSAAMTDIGTLEGSDEPVVIIVNAPSPGQFIYAPSYQGLHDQPSPAHMRILASAHSAVYLTRVDEHTLLVRPAGGFLLSPGTAIGERRHVLPLAHTSYACQVGDTFSRGADFPMTLGQRVELTGLIVEVTAVTADGRPLEARMRFAVPLDHPSLRWLQWDWGRKAYLSFLQPDLGDTVRVPGPF